MTLWQTFSKASFYPTLAYNLILEKVTSRTWYSRIDETVLLGALPFKSMTKQLIEKEGVQGVVSLNEDFEVEKFVNTAEDWKSWGVQLLRLRTPDFVASPSQTHLKQGVDFILEHRERCESVYVHCKAGRTRSATLVACYLMTVYDCSPSQAVEMILSKRPHVWLRKTQLSSIDCYYKENLEGKFPKYPPTSV
uniref:Phosphatidylglycerophosphatase and protein-tyrosine phosphatase 1 n=1 Tax=Phallusia mammillata TaxID=59560 RepID=A0A6F9DQU1_9ASCI|nr:phosphatidylglycerophosphatase and protein-tyrosine phosphatase 1-like [Phallusia mammillata]